MKPHAKGVFSLYKMVSQNNEAEIVINYFNGYVGNLLSLGENDGITLSNSYDLIQLGWGGDLFEPVIECYYKICNLHKEKDNVFAHPYGIANTSGKQMFYLTEDSLLASLNKDLALSWGGKHEVVYLDFMTVKAAINMAHYDKFDFITIDCEGEDLNILEQLNLTELGCKCLCIEHGNSVPNYNRIKEICSQHGLKKELLRNFENVIFAI